MGSIPLILMAILAVPTLQEKIYSHGPEGILWHYDICPMVTALRGSLQECEDACSLNDACTAFNFASGVDSRCELLECPIPIPIQNWKYGQGWRGFYQVTDRCPEAKGFVRVPASGNQCIKVFNVKLSWDDTTALCQDQGLMLVKPIDPVAMRKFIVEKYGDKQIWLDGQGTGSSVVWLRDGTTLPSSSPYWNPGQPGWSITTKHCLLLLSFKQHLTNTPTTPYLMWPCTDTNWMHAACELVN